MDTKPNEINVDNPKQPSLKTMSIGPGIRGIERGIERSVRLDQQLYVEIEAFIIENMVAEMEAGILAPTLIWSDAKTIPSELFRDKIDLLIAGYPCQPFSTAGQRKGVDDPRHLFPHIARSIDIIRPAICFFENVRGHITMGLREVIEELERLGYRVHWGIFSAEETGAAHKRERVFIMAVRREMDYSNFERFKQEHKVCSGRSCAEGMEDSIDTGMRRRGDERIERGCKIQAEGSSELGNDPVSRPGQPQQAWESPRVISRAVESSMGMSVNGYHFREDFLRALGNSVYPPTAELAWNVLSKKHGL